MNTVSSDGAAARADTPDVQQPLQPPAAATPTVASPFASKSAVGFRFTPKALQQQQQPKAPSTMPAVEEATLSSPSSVAPAVTIPAPQAAAAPQPPASPFAKGGFTFRAHSSSDGQGQSSVARLPIKAAAASFFGVWQPCGSTADAALTPGTPTPQRAQGESPVAPGAPMTVSGSTAAGDDPTAAAAAVAIAPMRFAAPAKGFQFNAGSVVKPTGTAPALLNWNEPSQRAGPSLFERVMTMKFVGALVAFFDALLLTTMTTARVVPPPLAPMVLQLLNKSKVIFATRMDVLELTSPNWWRNVDMACALNVDLAALAPRLRQLTLRHPVIVPPSLMKSLAALPKLRALQMQRCGHDPFGGPWSGFRALTFLDLHLSLIQNEDLVGIETLPVLRTLSLRYCLLLTDVARLGRCPALTDLDLTNVYDLDADSVAALGRSRCLRILTLSSGVAQVGRDFCAAPAIHSLALIGATLTPTSLDGLVECASLKWLHLQHCVSLHSLAALSQAQSLEKVTISETSSDLNPVELLEPLCTVPGLATLGFHTREAVPPVGHLITRMPRLKTLALRQVMCPTPPLPTAASSDQGDAPPPPPHTDVLLGLVDTLDVEVLELEYEHQACFATACDAMPKLTALILASKALNDDALACIAQLTRLVKLTFAFTPVQHLGFAPRLSCVKELLLLHANQMENEALGHIAQMPCLTELTLAHCALITNVEAVVGCPLMRQLCLAHLPFGDDGFGVPGANLQVLLLDGCPNFGKVKLLVDAPKLRALHVVDMQRIPSLDRVRPLFAHRALPVAFYTEPNRATMPAFR